MPTLNISVIRFTKCLKPSELELFRGAVIDIAALHNATLFHNHTGENFRYGYPLIQYKNLDGRTSLVGVNQGASELLWLRPFFNRELNIGYKSISFDVLSVENIEAQIGVVRHTMCYRLKNWMPLNQENDRLFHSTPDEGDRVIMLEEILTNSIVSFYKDMGYAPKKRINCRIEQRGPIEKVSYKEVDMRTMDIDFRTNALLPPFIGIGKGSSMGFGLVETR